LNTACGIEALILRLLLLAGPDSDPRVPELNRLRGRAQARTATGVHALREEFTRMIAPALAAEPRRRKAEG
jgi:hypothetical protein